MVGFGGDIVYEQVLKRGLTTPIRVKIIPSERACDISRMLECMRGFECEYSLH
jgi:hypothetical protein